MPFRAAVTAMLLVTFTVLRTRVLCSSMGRFSQPVWVIPPSLKHCMCFNIGYLSYLHRPDIRGVYIQGDCKPTPVTTPNYVYCPAWVVLLKNGKCHC